MNILQSIGVLSSINITCSMVGVAHAMGQIRQGRLNIWIELQFWVDKIIVSDLDWGNP